MQLFFFVISFMSQTFKAKLRTMVQGCF